ncbi:MAG TPA: hypothetical protein VGN69_05435 [Solirubrobacteraceae bacterium]|nr:hypothetical protein [Solirubrobacteraceae bacterium]
MRLSAGRLARCRVSGPVPYGAHLELFASDHVVVIPAGIGVAPPWRADGAYVRGGRCLYPLRTREPTGVIEVSVRAGPAPTLGDLFAVWGQPLSRHAMAGFRGTVRAYVNGVRWRPDPREIALAHHAQVVLEVGPPVLAHARYRFAPGL